MSVWVADLVDGFLNERQELRPSGLRAVVPLSAKYGRLARRGC